MEKDILEGKIGEVGGYDLEFKGGKLVLKVDAAIDIGKAGFFAELEADKVLDALAKAIPGQWDDVALNGLKAILKA